MSIKLIGLCGKKGHGKTELRNYLLENIRNSEPLSFAAPLKRMCMELFGGTSEHWYGSKKEETLPLWNKTPRNIMQLVGTEMFRDYFDKETWVKVFQTQLERMIAFNKEIEDNETKYVIVDDIRFDNEADIVEKYFGSIYRVVRLDGPVSIDSHSSENGVSDAFVTAQLEAADLRTLYLNGNYILEDLGLCLPTTP